MVSERISSLVYVQLAAQMVGLMLEDARRPAMQVFLVLLAVLIMPMRDDVEVTLRTSLVAVEAQAPFVEGARLLTCGAIHGIDDRMERELRYLARITVIIAVRVVLHHRNGKIETDLRTGQTHSRCVEHGLVHRLDELVQRMLAQLAVVAHALLTQHGLARFDYGQHAVPRGLEQTFDIRIELDVDMVLLSNMFRPYGIR